MCVLASEGVVYSRGTALGAPLLRVATTMPLSIVSLVWKVCVESAVALLQSYFAAWVWGQTVSGSEGDLWSSEGPGCASSSRSYYNSTVDRLSRLEGLYGICCGPADILVRRMGVGPDRVCIGV